MSVDERYRETPQRCIGKQQRKSEEALETEHLGKKSPKSAMEQVPHRKCWEP